MRTLCLSFTMLALTTTSAVAKPETVDKRGVEAAAKATRAKLKAACGCDVAIKPDYAAFAAREPQAGQTTFKIQATIGALDDSIEFLCQDAAAKATTCHSMHAFAITLDKGGMGGGCSLASGTLACSINAAYTTADFVLGAIGITPKPLTEAPESSDATASMTAANPGGSCTLADTAKLAIPDNLEVRDLVAADFNGDGAADVAASVVPVAGDSTKWKGGNVLVFINDGTGHFRAPVAYRATGVDDRPMRLAVGDLDGNGKPDLVSFHTGNIFGKTDGVLVLINTGNGAFKATPHVNLGVEQFEHFEIADVDGDHKADLVVSDDTGVFVIRGKGNGSFAKPAAIKVTGEPKAWQELADGRVSWTVRDVDGDGKAELVVTPRAYVRLVGERDARDGNAGNRGVCVVKLDKAAAATCFSSRATFEPHQALVADLDGDGKPDVIAGPDTSSYLQANAFALLHNTGKAFDERRTFGNGHMNDFKGWGAIDIDGDGKLDVVTFGQLSGAGLGVGVFRNDGHGKLATYSEVLLDKDFDTSDVAVGSFGGRSSLGVALYGWSRVATDNVIHVLAGRCK
jgi:FG-GAP-like repeat